MTLFPNLREPWSRDPNVRASLAAAEGLLSRRRRGNHRMPLLTEPPTGLEEPVDPVVRDWMVGVSPQDRSAQWQVIEYLRPNLPRVLAAIRWPRWLLLERAFLDGAETGDILFAALALRSMCEEVRWQHALDVPLDRLGDLQQDLDRMDLFLRLTRASMLTLPLDMVRLGKAWPEVDHSVEPAVWTAGQALNDYVHPNYGSHVAALNPRDAVAGRILLEACQAAYESFFSLSWAESQITRSSRKSNLREVVPWMALTRHFLRMTLPRLQVLSPPDVRDAISGDSIREWLLSAPGTDASERANRVPSDHQPTWEGASPVDVIQAASGMRVSTTMDVEFPEGAPKREDQDRFLRFTSAALDLCLLFDDMKAAAARAQLVRQLTIGNPIGIHLCVRSLIEHRAVRDVLLNRLGKAWDSTAVRARPGSPLPEQASGLDRQLGKFLASTKGSAEYPAPWSMTEEEGRRVVSVNVMAAVAEAFPPNGSFRSIYDLTSAVIHGRQCRGVDLATEGISSLGLTASVIGVAVLDAMLADAPLLRREYALLKFSIDNVMQHGGTAAATVSSRVQLQQSFGNFSSAELKAGRDYTGTGTREDPYQLGPHLGEAPAYLSAHEQLLRQLGIEITKIPPIESCGEGALCDHYVDGALECWVQLPFGGAGAARQSNEDAE
jgi:hypothetical protein